MRRSIAHGLALMTLFCGTRASADASPMECRDRVERSGGTQVQMLWSRSSGNCWVTVSPLETSDMIYRSFLFGSDGMLMVFNSFGDGPEWRDTGAREFYLFPRRMMPDFRFASDGNLIVTTASGAAAEFDRQKTRFLSLTDAVVNEATNVDRDNSGGIEIPEHDGILLDLGFAFGHSPMGKSDSTSRFTDRAGKTCAVLNREIFDYPGNSEDEIALKHPTDAELARFLAKRCPELDLTPLH